MDRLARKAMRGDDGAYAALVRAHADSLYRVARGYLRDEADVADAVQEAIIDGWRHIATLREPRYFKTWIIRILLNRCGRMLRERRPVVDIDAVPEPAVWDRPAGAQHGDGPTFEEMVDALDEGQGAVLALFYGEGMRLAEIGELLGISEDAAKQRLSRGRRVIARRFFPETLGDCEEGSER